MTRRNEPPNPTAKALVRARRESEMLRGAAVGLSAEELARCFGLASTSAVRRTVERARDRVCAHPGPVDVAFEVELARQASDAL